MCLRLQCRHPDMLMDGDDGGPLLAGQWLDWERYHRQFNVSINRDTVILAALATAKINQGLPQGEMPYRAEDLVPYLEDSLDDELSCEDLMAKIGIGSRFREAAPETA